jgi:hypothetical protein
MRNHVLKDRSARLPPSRARRQEIAIHPAAGAGRNRIVRLLLTEGLLLASLAALADQKPAGADAGLRRSVTQSRVRGPRRPSRFASGAAAARDPCAGDTFRF